MSDRLSQLNSKLPPFNGWFIFSAINVVIATLSLGILVIIGSFLCFPLFILEKISFLWAIWILRAARMRVVIHGFEHLPSGPAVLVGNHQGMFDILVLISHLPRPPVFVAKQELFRIPIFGQALRCLGHIPVDRKNREKAIASIKQGTAQLHKNNQQVVFFPEGTRTRNGEILEFKKGAFVFAKESGLPVVPVMIQGSYQALPPGVRVVRPGLIQVQILPPCDPAKYVDIELLLSHVRGEIQACLDRVSAKPTETQQSS